MFGPMLNETISLLKKNGEVVNGIKALVRPTKILIEDAKLPIEENDVLRRVLPSGLTEEFIVEDRGFNAALGGMKAHYQTKVRKVSQASKDQNSTPRNVFHLNGPHSRVNIHSTDSSVNISNNENQTQFIQLQEAIKSGIADIEKQTLILNKLEALQTSVNTPSYIERYQEFIGLTADCMTIISPFMPFLASFLSS